MERNLNKAEIKNVLQKWQKGLLLSEQESMKSVVGYTPENLVARSSGDGKSSGLYFYKL